MAAGLASRFGNSSRAYRGEATRTKATRTYQHCIDAHHLVDLLSGYVG
jgi:hypothetical protein